MPLLAPPPGSRPPPPHVWPLSAVPPPSRSRNASGVIKQPPSPVHTLRGRQLGSGRCGESRRCSGCSTGSMHTPSPVRGGLQSGLSVAAMAAMQSGESTGSLSAVAMAAMRPAVTHNPSTPRTERELLLAAVPHNPCTPRTEREQLLLAVPTPLRHVARGPIGTQRSASPMQRSVGGGGRPVSPSPACAQFHEHFPGAGPQTQSARQLHASDGDRSTSAMSVRACNPLRKAFTHDDFLGHRSALAARAPPSVPVGVAFGTHRPSAVQEPRNASPMRLWAWQPNLRRSYSTFACTESRLTQAQLAQCPAAGQILSDHSRQSILAPIDLPSPVSCGRQERIPSNNPDLAAELWTEPTFGSQGSEAPLLPAIAIDGAAGGGAGDESVEYSEPRADLDGLVEYLEDMTSLGKRFTEATYVVNSWTFGGVIPLWHHGFVLLAEDHGFLTLDFSRRGILWDTFDTFPDLPDNTVLVKTYIVDVNPWRIRTYCEETKPFSWHSNDCQRWARGVMQVMNITEDPLEDCGCYRLPPTPLRWPPVMPLTSPWPGTDCLACRVTSNSEGRPFPDCLR